MADPQAGYFKTAGGSSLYAVYHDTPGKKKPVVLAGPLFEERKSAYRFLRTLAERLAAAGHPCLRFDYRGSGESGGSAARRRWAHLHEDLASARTLLSQLSGQPDCALLGLRLGATLALQAVFQQPSPVVALAPVIRGETQVRQWKLRSKIRAELTVAPVGTDTNLRSKLAVCPDLADLSKLAAGPASSLQKSRQDACATTIDFDGYQVASAFFDDVSALDLRKKALPLSQRGWLVQISHREQADAEHRELLANLGLNARLEVLRLEPFWDKVDETETGPLEELALAALGSL
jgi:pimeloyl-ACP methyl ester carboxylesterase